MKDFLIADLFCGAGGTSAVAVEAALHLGRLPRVTAVNHWPVAIATHTANHPGSRHLCTGIDAINPRDLFAEGELDLLWASPECTHHSIARGGKPINDQSRSTAWCVTRWAEALRPPAILIENVPEFATWGPIGVNGRPLKSRKGETFQAWCNVLRSLGYKVDYRLLCAADYGDPTTRTRLFVQAVRGRRKIVWPDATHTKHADLLTARRWAPARDIIDWSLPAKSIYERERPLSPKTMARIEAGLRKFGLRDFIVPQQSNPSPKSVDDPLPTVVAEGSGPKLVQPFLVTVANGGEDQYRSNSVETPLSTVTAGGVRHGLVQPYWVAWDNQSAGSGGGIGSMDDPISTVVTKARHGVAEPFLVELRGTHDRAVETSAKSLDDPCSAVTTSGAHHALIEPFIISAGGPECPARGISSPVGTVLTRDHRALVEPHLLPQQQGGALRPVSEPSPTVSTAGAIALVEPYLVSFYGNGQAHDLQDPAPTVTCKDRFGLVRPVVEIDGNRYLLDIRFRMLQPHELALAQGFPRDYQFTGTKTDQVKQIGNAVPRRLARAIVAAVLSQNSDVSALVDAEEGKEVAA